MRMACKYFDVYIIYISIANASLVSTRYLEIKIILTFQYTVRNSLIRFGFLVGNGNGLEFSTVNCKITADISLANANLAVIFKLTFKNLHMIRLESYLKLTISLPTTKTTLLNYGHISHIFYL